MNQEQIIQMAREAGFFIQKNEIYSMSTQSDQELTEWIERFAALVAQHEREACAELCEMLDIKNPKGKSWDEGTLDCANAIRARGQA